MDTHQGEAGACASATGAAGAAAPARASPEGGAHGKVRFPGSSAAALAGLAESAKPSRARVPPALRVRAEFRRHVAGGSGASVGAWVADSVAESRGKAAGAVVKGGCTRQN